MIRLAVRFSILLISCLFAQPPTIRTSVPLVVVPVTVTDARGNLINDLTASDFVVRDNGQPQAMPVEAPDVVTAPFHLVVLVQTSDISDSALRKVQKVGTMVQDAVVGTNGAAALVTFADQVQLVQDFTNSDEDLARAFHHLHSVATRKGRLLDAAAQGLHLDSVAKLRTEGLLR